MQLVRWNPWNDVRLLGNSLYRMLGDTAFPARYDDSELTNGRWLPAVDVYETDDAYVVKAELPGMKKEDITIDVKDGILTVRGERCSETEVKEKRYHRKERVFGSFQRSFSLPEGVASENITAEFKNGILTVSIPRPEEKKPKQIKVH
ncbi:MAG: Hsp20/alpha crystallin family protein [Desulfococcus multivorans]|uniref:Hsp20/alpha crystallin family protein n=1 Tax=Desulfococcus sp. TaxID=2025834 RepID=UPI002A3BA54B|nr:Hsp20/alpha crystallin family protein [Desulfococcus multivorans]